MAVQMRGLQLSEPRGLKQLESENGKLKQLPLIANCQLNTITLHKGSVHSHD